MINKKYTLILSSYINKGCKITEYFLFLSFMEHFVVSARKYRPQRFDTVLGQNNIAATLKNAIQRKQLAHAYLFCGPRGVGKTTCARIFARTINCAKPTPDLEACGTCESCRSFAEGRSYCIHELDAASNNSVDDIRQLIEKVRIPPPTWRPAGSVNPAVLLQRDALIASMN